MSPPVDRGFGFAWISFGMAVAVHVLDEAAHDFLAVYNPNARAIRARLPFVPIPTFTLESFVTSLAIAIAIFLCLSPFAFRGMRWARVAAIPIALLAGILNAMGHTFSSIYYHRWMPGVYSSPLLVLAAIFLIATARIHRTAAANAAGVH
jgi:uncharacterized protein with HXXEE motif